MGIFSSGLVMVVLLGWCMVWMFVLKVIYDPPFGSQQGRSCEARAWRWR